MPENVVHCVTDALNTRNKATNGSRMLILGLTYKPNVDDERESPSYVLMDLLSERGAELEYYDPYVSVRSEEHTSELQSHHDLVCRLLLEKKNNTQSITDDFH